MRAYQLPKGGAGIDALVKIERPNPKPAYRQVLVKVGSIQSPARITYRGDPCDSTFASSNPLSPATESVSRRYPAWPLTVLAATGCPRSMHCVPPPPLDGEGQQCHANGDAATYFRHAHRRRRRMAGRGARAAADARDRVPRRRDHTVRAVQMGCRPSVGMNMP
jgi:hypothetical protein